MKLIFYFLFATTLVLSACISEYAAPKFVSCEDRTVFEGNAGPGGYNGYNHHQSGTYTIGSNESFYFRSPYNDKVVIEELEIKSGGQLDYCGRLEIEKSLSLYGTMHTREDLKFKKDLYLFNTGRLYINGKVKVEKSFNFSGTLIFESPNSSLEVKGKITKYAGARIINPQNNIGPTFIP